MATYDALAASVLQQQPRAGSTRVVCVDGPACSGKSSFAAALAAALRCPVVHMDDLYPGWDGLAAAVPRLVDWVLEPLEEGTAAGYLRWDWERGEYAERHEVPPAPALVVEGCGSGSRAAARFAALLVWVEAPREVRLRRAAERDGAGFLPHWERWARQERAVFAAERTRERAALHVDGVATALHAGVGFERVLVR